MEARELERLLDDLESDRVERTSSVSEPDRIRQAICAFANDLPNHKKPGVVVIGVDDHGNPTGLAITDRLLCALADMRGDGNITPFPVMKVQKHSVRGAEVAVVEVTPSDAPPVRFRGRVWIRVGPRRAVATAEEERRLAEKRRSLDQPYDLHPLRSSTMDDLDVELFRRTILPSVVAADVLEDNQRGQHQQLMSLRFIDTSAEHAPTVLGVLATGYDPRQHLPGAYVQFLRIDGTDLADPVKDRKELEGPLPDVLRSLDEVLRLNITQATDITSGDLERRHPDYALAALQQLARNCVLHRNYEGTNAPVRITWFEDRVELLSPGGPYGLVTRDNFGQPGITDYRNPNLAEIMAGLGYVQKFGVGIAIAQRALEENGNPPPEFVVEDSHVLVIVRRR